MLGASSTAITSEMISCISHRGPDGKGEYSELMDKGGVSFGHSRLSILDIDESDQPAYNDHGTVLIHNGEIYNYRQIRTELEGYPWRSSGDTEAILALHSHYLGRSDAAHEFPRGNFKGQIRSNPNAEKPGNPAEKHVEWVSKLDGMWGFALWDSSRRELILCRDPMGVKPLLRTTLEDGTLLFASEAKAFHGHPDYSPRPDIDAIAVRLAYEYPLDMTTLFEGVCQVGQGTIETWGLDSEGRAVLTGISRFSNDRVEPLSGLNFDHQSRILLESLRNGVKQRLISDVPIGIVLSGGLDSSLIATLAKEESIDSSNKPPECWTVAGSEENPDYIYAQKISSSLDLAHNTRIMPENCFWNDLPKFVWNGEDADVSVVFWQEVFDLMSPKVKVGLCGQGADELHGGYDRYRNLHGHSKLVERRMSLYDGHANLGLSTGIGQPWVDSSIWPSGHFSSLQSTIQFEIDRGQLSNFQLRLADRHGMAAGLEARVPFLSQSHRIASHSIPMEWRVSGEFEKIALREAASTAGLPEEIVSRPKMPAGTATAPKLVDEVIEEMRPHAMEWAEDYGILEPLLRDQPDMALGIRLLHALHFTEGGPSRAGKDLFSVIDDVGNWP